MLFSGIGGLDSIDDGGKGNDAEEHENEYRPLRHRRVQEDEVPAENGDEVVTADGEDVDGDVVPTSACLPCVCDAPTKPPSSSDNSNNNSTTEGSGRLKLRFLVAERSFARLQVMLSRIAEDYERVLGVDRAPEIIVSGVPTLSDLQREIRYDVLKEAGQFDGYILTPLWIGELASGLYELTDFIKEYSAEVDPEYWTDILLFYREVISSYDGNLYLFPFDGDVISLFYRRDLLEKHGKEVPQTWDEYNELAAFFHGKTETIYATDEETGVDTFVKNVTLSGSCIGRKAECGNAYWAQTVLGTLTQVRGTYEGSMLDSSDLNPLLGPAFEETLRLLGEQTKYGAPNEFEGCIDIHVDTMNDGACVLTYNWGNSFSDHVREGSTVRGKLGAAPIPGSPRVLNRATGKLDECTKESCPYAVLDDRTGRYINRSPYGAYGGFSGAVSGSVAPENQRAAAEFFAFATSSKKAIKYVIPDANNPDANPVPTGMDPARKSMLEVEEWTSRGFDEEAVRQYKHAIESQLGSKNVVIDMRFEKAADYMAALDNATTVYTNRTRLNELGDVPVAMRAEIAGELDAQWRRIENNFDSTEGRTAGALLQQYQRDRGVYKPYRRRNGGFGTAGGGDGGGFSNDALVGIGVSAALILGFAMLFTRYFVIKAEKRKREEQWYIDPQDITNTKELLGRGSYGVVTKGFLRGTPVALKHPKGCKCLEENAAGMQENGEVGDSSNEGKKEYENTPQLTTLKETGVYDVHSRPAGANSLLDDTYCASLAIEASTFHSKKSSGCFGRKENKSNDSLRSELLMLIKLRQDNIVQTLGATLFDKRKKELVLVLQYMEHGSVRSILNDPNGVAGTAGMALEMQWALQVARGIGFLHSVPPPSGPMLHNDLKSSNVLLDGSYNAHISDFGLATKMMGGVWSTIRSTRQTNIPRGSLLWMSPEVLNGAVPTPASDVYSYSMFLVELMTRKRPYGVCATEESDSDGRRISRSSICRSSASDGNIEQTSYGRRIRGSICRSSASDEKIEQTSYGRRFIRRGSTFRLMTSGESSQSVEKNSDKKCLSEANTDFSVKETAPTAVPVLEVESTKRNLRKRLSTNFNTFLDIEIDHSTEPPTEEKPVKSEVEFVAIIDGETVTRDEILESVKDMTLDPPFRPTLPDNAPQVLQDICTECWHKNPNRRPSMKEVENRLTAAFSNENVTQRLMRRGSVFDSILPPEVQDKLARGETIKPKPYDQATVIFSDIVGFTNISSALTAEEVGDLIYRLFTKFDDICKATGVKKLDIIGDAFLGVAGVPDSAQDHAGRAAEFALGAIAAAKLTFICPAKPQLGFVKVRFGLASGSVVATVIGSREHPKYTLFGNTVNTASRMESSGLPDRCQCTKETVDSIKENGLNITFESRGVMEIKGRGQMETFWLTKD